MKAYFKSKVLIFKNPSGTSRGILNTKQTWYIVLENNNVFGIGECSPLTGLSLDDKPGYEEKLVEITINPELYCENTALLKDWPSIRFGLEAAKLDLEQGGNQKLFESPFSNGKEGIPINGLVWMGEKSFMQKQIKNLLSRGFRCLKMKIGAITFQDELEILSNIRKEFNVDDLILRVDANGAFPAQTALEKLKKLSDFDLHSIEQPILAGQLQEMAYLCANSPIPIALDEELIPLTNVSSKEKLLRTIKPQYIIIKPSLLGGFDASEEWIDIGQSLGIDWWATSALESNIGLNAISQWTYMKNLMGHQGLGTGSLYTNNIDSPLEIRGEEIFYNSLRKWKLNELL